MIRDAARDYCQERLMPAVLEAQPRTSTSTARS